MFVTRNATCAIYGGHAGGTTVYSQCDSSCTILNNHRNSKHFFISLAYPQNPGWLLTETLR